MLRPGDPAWRRRAPVPHLASGAGELGNLRRHALTVRGDSCVAIFHDFVMHLVYEPEKPHDFKAPVLVQNS